MPLPKQGRAGAQKETDAAGRFQFISVQVPDEANDLATRRLARSHAVKQALQNKRKIQQASMQNFRVKTPNDEDKPKRTIRKSNHAGVPVSSPVSLSASILDPFQTLAVDSSRLQILLNDYQARHAPEPVFSFVEELDFQNFRSVFRAGLVDPALLNALMFSLAFAAGGGIVNQECLVYRGRTIQYIRERMASLDKAISESTIGSILLLVGVEAQLGTTSQVQLHMGAIQHLLSAYQTTSAGLTEGIKRAIFWQDLNASVLAGSKRIVNHTTFAELRWTRESISPDFFEVPPGFQVRFHLFNEGFIEVIRDIHALQRIRDIYRRGVSMALINSHTASIQSRLEALPKATPVSKCCHLAAYICSVMLCCTVWCALVIPSNVSTQLLRELQKVRKDPIWDEHTDLLLWLICIGGAFSPSGTVRSDYVALFRSTGSDVMSSYDSWTDFTGTTGFIGGDAFHALYKAQPGWSYTILVRSEDKGKSVQKEYPEVKLAVGSLDDSEVIKKAASEADIVIHTADSSDHQGAAQAIGAGLRSTHSSSNPGYWIHISGTGILCWYDMDNKRYGEGPLPEQAYDDLEGVDKVTSLPDTAFHRDVDKLVLSEAAQTPDSVKVAIVCPPTIYGTGRGPANKRSRQIPGLTATTLEKGFGPIIGAGKTEWDNVHVHDLSTLIVLLSQRAASSEKHDDEQEIWGPKGYFFAENGTHRWSDMSSLIAKEANKQGVIDSDKTKTLDPEEAKEKLGFEALSWGLNSRGEARRARKYLGWKPEGKSLEDWLPESVQTEARRLNKA
ncbi:hypothetical protein FSARC_3559 [Fusarium sarcochroum]|uniref:NAD(P)-binding domain-containing protein n=1 Tax=Fusarium sarcochroum TaxID=1208366 RepID=A0A8H4XBN5_9HYPO|nr:hypothetical protein FSARC_3559 [Fusarium sarcochroum]